MELGVLTVWDQKQRCLASLTQPVLKSYCRKHGYCLLSEERTANPKLTPFWLKIEAVGDYLADFDWLAWVDVDCLVMDRDVKLDSFLDEQHDLVITCDLHGFNSGVMLFRNCSWVKEFLKLVLQQSKFYVDYYYNSEQTAMAYLLFTQDLDRIKVHPGPADPLNSYLPGKFIYHAMGLVLEEKVRRIRMARQPRRAPYIARWPLRSVLLPTCNGH